MTPWHHSSNVLIELVRYGAWVLEFLASSQVWSGVRKVLQAPGRYTPYLHTWCLTDWEPSLKLSLCCAWPEKQFYVPSAGGHIVILLLALGVPQLDLEIVGICAPFLPCPRNSKSGRTASLALKSWCFSRSCEGDCGSASIHPGLLAFGHYTLWVSIKIILLQSNKKPKPV